MTKSSSHVHVEERGGGDLTAISNCQRAPVPTPFFA
jgi:hypothetical protein